ncbi:MAG TPA: organomercurial lyase [Kofleriaceae bacterium]|nr:organomercurial lyase [Kofleriaceae bacterium]
MEPHAALDALVHHHILTGIVDRGHAPPLAELAASVAVSPSAIEDSLGRLGAAHGLVLHPGSTDVWIVHPFSLSPTATWVEAHDGRGWWAPCLWCATGIAALAAPRAAIHARLAGEAEAITIAIEDGHPRGDLLVHFALPPRDAWTNVVHFCSTVLPFRREADIDAWCARHRLPRGAAVPIAQVAELGRVWYGRHLDRDWRKWTVAEAQAIFEQVGLTDGFWRLPDQRGRF